MAARSLAAVIESVPASDGAGVKLRRSLGRADHLRHDPFLMLDEFFSDNPDDYLAGFPAHPHRGFETVTYMLDGRMRHEDSVGNRGDLGPGDLQWMTAARGIIHSEMPQQTEGRMRGFQLWLNLPASHKMNPADYRDIPAGEIPVAAPVDGVRIKVIAGHLELPGMRVAGPAPAGPTEPLFLDLHLEPGRAFAVPLPAGHAAFLYLYDGSATVGAEGRALPRRAAGLLTDGDAVAVAAGPEGARLLVLAARPIREPVVQYGPFVMNTRAEIERAILDYQQGRLA
jgi:hypothetical protein